MGISPSHHPSLTPPFVLAAPSTHLLVWACSRIIDEVPTRAELIQYQTRFVELFDLVAVTLEETRKHYNSPRPVPHRDETRDNAASRCAVGPGNGETAKEGKGSTRKGEEGGQRGREGLSTPLSKLIVFSWLLLNKSGMSAWPKCVRFHRPLAPRTHPTLRPDLVAPTPSLPSPPLTPRRHSLQRARRPQGLPDEGDCSYAVARKEL